MTKQFEELEVYKDSRLLTKEIYLLTEKRIKGKDYSLSDQMRRASVSIMSNIAEGYERNSKNEFARFLLIAKGSSGELRSHLSVAFDMKYIDIEEYENLTQKSMLISAMIFGLIRYLKSKKT
ncbi:MAG: four helix bundle protein [bacterium]|nr:four helix bundle protein [bacterium]